MIIYSDHVIILVKTALPMIFHGDMLPMYHVSSNAWFTLGSSVA